MMLCLDIICLCLEQPVWFKNTCDSSIPLLDFCHLRAFFSNSYSGPKLVVTKCQTALESNYLNLHGGIHERFNLKVDLKKINRQQKGTQK